MVQEEMMDVVDDNDAVIGVLSRKQTYVQNVRKRIVYIFAIDPDTQKIGVSVRAKDASWAPLHYGATAYGHVMTGETGGMAAQREMQEELKTDKPLQFLQKHPSTDENNGQIFYDYLYAVFAGEKDIVVNKEELDRVDFMPFEALKKLCDDSEALLHPLLSMQVKVLEKHWDSLKNNG